MNMKNNFATQTTPIYLISNVPVDSNVCPSLGTRTWVFILPSSQISQQRLFNSDQTSHAKKMVLKMPHTIRTRNL